MLRKLMLLAATMMVMSLLAVTPAFAQADVAADDRGCEAQDFCVPVCHKEDVGQPEFTLFVPPSAVPAHLAHGDDLGECDGGPSPNPRPDRDRDRDRDADFLGVPFADVDVENEAESGPVDLDFDVTNTGDYASQCVPAVQFGNTGNFNNAPTLVQGGSGGFVDDNNRDHNGLVFFDDNDDDHNGLVFFDDDNDNRRNDFRSFNDSSIDDFEPGGIEFSVSPEVSVDCSHTVQQSSAASSYTPYYPYPYPYSSWGY